MILYKFTQINSLKARFSERFFPVVYSLAFLALHALPTPTASFADGQSLEKISTFAEDPALYYALRTVLFFDVIGIIVLLYLLFFHRVPLQKTSTKIFMGIGIVIFPAVTVVVGSLAALENAKTVEFCSSCHDAMGEYVEDMRDPDNHTQSASHYKNRWINQNQCYGCHTGYGILGSVHAKIKGLGEVFKYYTGTWKQPIKMSEPFPNKDCLKCHGQTKSYSDSKAHKQLLTKLVEDKMYCAKCHHPMHGRKEPEDEYEKPIGFF